MSRQKRSVDLSQIEQKFSEKEGQGDESNSIPAASLVRQGGKAIPKVSKQSVRFVDPNACVPWRLADRIDDSWFTPKELEDLVVSLRSRGQDIPAVVRPASKSSGKDWEIIVGRRRWAAAKLIDGFELSVVVQELSDADAASLMNSENMDRADISEFERAISFKRLLEAKVFPTAEALLAAMPTAVDNLNKVKLSHMLRAAEIYDVPHIQRRLVSLREVRTSVAVKIARLLDDESQKKRCQQYCEKAGEIGDTKSFLKGLLEALSEQPVIDETHEFRNDKGQLVFSAKFGENTARVDVDRQALRNAGKMAFVEAMRDLYDELSS